MSEKNINMGSNNHAENKVWYKVWWKAMLGFLSFGGVSLGIFNLIITVNKEWENYQEFKCKIELLEVNDSVLESRIESNSKYINRKKRSFAVGFRVVWVIDEETGNKIREHKYRGWDGVEYTVHRDEHYSNMYGYDYFFYIDKYGEKKYCY